MKRREPFKKEEFEAIKMLESKGLSSNQIAKVFHCSNTSVYAFRKYPDWKTYEDHKIEYARNLREKSKKTGNGKTVISVQTGNPETRPDQILALLANINNVVSKLYELKVQDYKQKMEYLEKRKTHWPWAS